MALVIPDVTAWLDSILLLLKLYIGVLVGSLLIVLVLIANFVLGINIPNTAIKLIEVMFDTMKSLWLGIINTFHFDNKRQIFALAMLCFCLMIGLFMAFNVNQMVAGTGGSGGGTGGSISFGSGAVRGSSEGAGAKEGSGGWFGNGSQNQPSVTATTMSVGQTTMTTETVTTITYPDHCYNGLKDYDEEDLNCGGSCIPCHCLDGNKDSGEGGVDCGSGCPDACFCSPTGMSNQCSLSYCCPSDTATGFCQNRCARQGDISYSQPDFTEDELLDLCNNGLCYDKVLSWLTSNASILGDNDNLDWY